MKFRRPPISLPILSSIHVYLPTTKSRNLFEMMCEFVLVAFKFLFKVPGRLKMAIFEFTDHTHSSGFFKFWKMMISEPLMHGFLVTYVLGKKKKGYILTSSARSCIINPPYSVPL